MNTNLTNDCTPFTLEEITSYATTRRKGVHMVTHCMAQQLLATMQREAKLREALEDILLAVKHEKHNVAIRIMAEDGLRCEYRDNE